jgi:chorismate synthase
MNGFGKMFKVNLFGESHGVCVGVVVDGCPAGIKLDEQLFTPDLSRRKSGKSGTTLRNETDIPEIISGVLQGVTTGAPITLLFRNQNIDSSDYTQYKRLPRPGHADFVTLKKYHGFADLRGGGHFSGRLTVALTAAGIIAKEIIKPAHITAELVEAGKSADIEPGSKQIQEAMQQKDSIGGIIVCRVKRFPVGVGAPFFDGLESVISHAVFAIPGIKAIAFGSGFEAASMKGSNHNDMIINEMGTTKTNHAGGINGGISNGNEIYFRVAIKPTPSIGQPQQTFNFASKTMDTLTIEGRHDVCFALRLPPVVEAATAIALADLWLQR